jgi:hypothetical protein
MNEDIELMQKKFNTFEVDWMGSTINGPSCLTRHHIIKKEDGGSNDINNYALLTVESHRLLHYLEENNYVDYVNLNKMFLELNKSMAPPTIEYYDNIKKIIKKVKKIIKNKRRVRRKK